MNRVIAAIEKTKAAIETSLISGKITQEKLNGLHSSLDMTLPEYCRFQEIKSLAVATGQLTQDEGMTVYAYLGEGGPAKFNRQPVEVKISLTKLFSELLNSSPPQVAKIPGS